MINVITPCFNEDLNIILRNLKSINEQTISNLEYKQLVIFDGIKRNDVINNDNLKFNNLLFFTLRNNHNDYGDYARKIGTKISLKNKVSAITYLDADNYVDNNHLEEILSCYNETKKDIIISKRRLIDRFNQKHEDIEVNFFDTNSITFFNDAIKIGLLWANYPLQLSLIGDRIISHYLNTYHSEKIAFTKATTVNYSYSKISKIKQNNLKKWYNDKYHIYKNKFVKNFGFNLQI